ncbi:MAG TPA: hypothetical protein DER01_21965 [Phycisphaerales bacterium]|nr:hypothetical protein [Phycisphaerales bacterium]
MDFFIFILLKDCIVSELIVKLTQGTDDTVKELNALCDGKTHDRKYSRNLPQPQMQGHSLGS